MRKNIENKKLPSKKIDPLGDETKFSIGNFLGGAKYSNVKN